MPAQATGKYTITKDGWDGAVSETCNIVGSTGKAVVTYLFPYAETPGFNPVTITVDPATGAATVAKQTYGSYGAGYENFTCEGTGGFFFS